MCLVKCVGTFWANRPTYLAHYWRTFVPVSVHIWYSIWVYCIVSVYVWCSVCTFGAVFVYVWCSVCVRLTQYQCTSDPAFVSLNKCDAVRRPLCTEHWIIFPLYTVCGFCLHFSGVHTSKQCRQCTYKVTSGRVRVTSQCYIFSGRVCSPSYPA